MAKAKKKSPIKSVTYSRLSKKGCAIYENQRVEATAEVGPGMTPEEALAEARAFVLKALDLGPSKSEYDRAKATVDEYKAING